MHTSICMLLPTMLIPFLSITTTLAKFPDTPVHIFPGTYFIPLHPTAIYESSIPISYVIPMNRTKSNINISRPFPPCLSTGQADSCQVNNALKEMEKIMTTILEDNDPRTQPAPGRSRRSLDSIGNFLSWCCSTATEEELHTLTANEEAVNSHLNNMQQIEKLDHEDLVRSSVKIEEFTTNVSNILHSVHTALDTFKNSLNSSNINVQTLYFTFLTLILRTNTLLHKHLFISQSHDIHNHCKNNLIPSSAIPISTFQNDLTNLDTKLFAFNYSLAIPISDIHKYYDLPIVNCISSPSTTILNIRIPIRHTNTSWTLYKFLPTPLAWLNQTCTLSQEPIILAKSDSQYRIISGEQLQNCNVKKDKMCFLPRQTGAASLTQMCAILLLKAAHLEDIMAHCDYQCHPKTQSTIVTTVNPDTFILTHPSKHLKITCENTHPNDIPPIPSNLPGAFKLILPCHCDLLEDSTFLITRTFPCPSSKGNLPSILHILPASWSKLRALHLHPTSADHFEWTNLSSILDSDWQLETPSFKIRNNIAPDAFDPVNLPKSWYDIHSDKAFYVMPILLIWMLILTLIVIYLAFKIYILKITMRPAAPTQDYPLR